MTTVFSKIKRLLHTLRFLKASQLFYQIKDRVERKRYLQETSRNKVMELSPVAFSKEPVSACAYSNPNTFCFLNLSKTFGDRINWDFPDYGKLWNYNLEYFDYLNQKDISVEKKNELIRDFYQFSVAHKRVLEPYPVSLRAVNIIKFTIREKQGHQDHLRFVYSELDFLHHHYEFRLLGNHLLENAFALCLGGVFFKEPIWHQKAVRVLYRELKEQILADGTHFELSPMYHKIIFFRLLELIDWYSQYENREEKFLDFCKVQAGKMRSWLEQIQFENGDIPLFSDSARRISYPGSFLQQYADLLGISPAELLLNESGYRSYKNGLYEIKMDFAQIGADYQPGHSHADALSFILYHRGMPLFVEQGTSTYQTGERRDLERSTRAHNTVVVKNQNQSDVWGGFRVGNRAKTTILRDGDPVFEGCHDGYKKYRILHTRSFRFDHRFVEITDHLSNRGEGVLYMHLHPSCVVRETGEARYEINEHVLLSFINGKNICIEAYDYAEEFNITKKAFRIAAAFVDTITAQIQFN